MISPSLLLAELSSRKTYLQNLVGGKWVGAERYSTLINPLNGAPLLQYPDTQPHEFGPFTESLKSCPKSGLHNPIKNIERYVMLGEVFFNVAQLLGDPGIEKYFAELILSAMPKSEAQRLAEVRVTRQGYKHRSGDNVRFLAKGMITPGDHFGQESRDYRWPYGPTVIISPFNFPLEILALQLLGALAMGNRVTIKPASTVGLVAEQFLILLHHAGLPLEDVDLIHCKGSVMNEFLRINKDVIRMTQFTGSSEVAENLSDLLHGKVRIEDAGFNWKILGPDFDRGYLEYVAWQCDQDAYSASGQKCSAQSILFAHENWMNGGIIQKMKIFAERRYLSDLTVGPVLSVTTGEMLEHIAKLSDLAHAKVLFGGKPLAGHSIPPCYGAIEPTAVYVPLLEILHNPGLVLKEIFGPVQVVTDYDDGDIPEVLALCEMMQNHLTGAIVSADPVFVNRILGVTVNGTTYAGMRARTTGAPQNHWFGPCGDPRSAGIGTPEAIIHTWSAQRCVIHDVGPIPKGFRYVQS